MKTDTTQPSLHELVSQTIASAGFALPPLPDLAVRLRQMLADEDVDASDVVDLLKADPAVTASIFQAANSPLYGGLTKITELQQAVARLGLSRVGTLVTTLELKGKLFDASKSNRAMLRKLWNHSIASATVCQWLARRDQLDDNEAFIAGLLHGIGRLLVLKSLDIVRADLGPDKEKAISSSVISEVMETFQVELGERVLREWNLPEIVCSAVNAVDMPVMGVDNRLLVIIQAADRITRKLGVHPTPDPELVLLEEPAVECLELSDLEAATILVDLEDEILAVKNLF